ncbi:hypothetical protein Tco_1163174 [Tanacetum coccineum]
MIAGIEDTHHEPSDAMHNPSQPFEISQKRLVSFVTEIHTLSIDSLTLIKNGILSSVIIKQHCGWSSRNQRYKLWCCILVLAKSLSLPHAHAQALKVKHSVSRLLLLNKNVIGQKA